MRTIRPKQEHTAIIEDIQAVISKHKDTVTPLEMLAIFSNFVGRIIAAQDQRYVDNIKAMATVSDNIKQGNLEVIRAAHKDMKPQGNA